MRDAFDAPCETALTSILYRWTPFDPQRDFPDLGTRFISGDEYKNTPIPPDEFGDLSWSAVLKRTFEAYIRGERPNMYGEWLQW